MLHRTTRGRRKNVTYAIAGLALSLTLTGCGSSSTESEESTATIDSDAQALLPAEIREAGVVKAGTTPQFPPWSYFEAGNTAEPTGFDPEIVKEIARRLDLDLEWTSFEFQGLVPAIQSGRIQIAAAGINDTEEREETAIFVNDLIGRNGLLFPAEQEGEYERFNDFCGLTMAVVTGSVSVAVIEDQNKSCEAEGLPPMEKLELPENAATLLAVKSGRADAVFQTYPGATYQIEQDPSFAGMVLDEGLNSKFTPGIAVDKSLPELADAFEAALQGMIEDGTYADILADNGVDVQINAIPEARQNWTTNGFLDD